MWPAFRNTPAIPMTKLLIAAPNGVSDPFLYRFNPLCQEGGR